MAIKTVKGRIGRITAPRKTMAAAVAAPKPASDFTPVAAEVRTRFSAMVCNGERLFTTDATGLFEAYLAAFPMADRQEHNCRTCQRFIEQFGGLAVIDEDGTMVPAMWGRADQPRYDASLEAMEKIVRRAKVTGVFLTSAEQWGTPTTGDWHHFAVKPNKGLLGTWGNAMLSAGQAMAEKLEDHKNVQRALAEFPLAALATAVTVLKSDALYRSDKCLGAAEWLLSLQTQRATVRGPARDNLLWRAIATAPAGFCHPRSGMIGTLLEDIIAGLPFDQISRRFAEKMNPGQYMRPSAAPSAGNIEQAEKIFSALGLAPSLRRRYARLNEVRLLWSPAPPASPVGGVFGHLKPKEAGTTIEIPAKAITWVKFAAEVLPQAATIELTVPSGVNNFSALVTAADPDAPPILRWDSLESRYPVSSYMYIGGSTSQHWGLDVGTRRKITGIALQPHGEGVLLIIDGCKDRGAPGLALFPETLKTELHSVRSVIEAHSRTGKIEGAEDASACGLALAKGAVRGCPVRVASVGSEVVMNYNIDRWD